MTGGCRVKVVALGNSTASDDGLALRALERLRARGLPPGVELVSAERDPLRLVEEVEGCEKLVVLDAIYTGASPPGTLHKFRFEGEVQERPLTLHRLDGLTALGLALALAKRTPKEVVIIGLEPKDLGPGLSLSPEVERRLDALVKEVLAEIGRPDG